MSTINKKNDIFTAVFVTFAFATISLLLRLIARRMTRVKLWWDDFWVILAWIGAVGWNIVVLIWIYYGLGHAVEDINHLDEVEILYWGNYLLYVAELLYAFSLAFSKFAILAFFWRMFKTSGIRVPIQILFGLSILWLLARTFVAVFHCWPVEAFWDRTIDSANCPINDSQFFFGSVLAHLLIDLAILALPVLQVRKLQLATGQKIAVTGLFAFGLLVCIASVAVLVESANFDPLTPELPLDIAAIMIWASVEVNLAIISGKSCLPMLRPIFRKMMPGSILGSNERSQQITRKDKGGAMKLATIKRSREDNDDDSSSTFNFADPEHCSMAPKPDFDARADPDELGPQTYISSPQNRSELASVDDVPFEADSPPSRPMILVKSETSVRYSDRL